MQDGVQKLAIEFIKNSQKILILPSSPPDGDSIGSAIALHLALKKLGKQTTVVCHDPIPEVLQFLPQVQVVDSKLSTNNDFIITLDKNAYQIEKIKSAVGDDQVQIIITPKEGQLKQSDFSFEQTKGDYDLIITVDTAELSQLRGLHENNIELFSSVPLLNIDHHVSNTHFGKINYVDVMASSATELVLGILEKLSAEHGGKLIDEDIATLLLTGIITDTGSFQNANTTPRSFERASKLVGYGARQQEIIRYIYKTKQLSQLKLWGRILSKIQTDDTHRIVWSAVSQQDFRDTGSTIEETGDVIDELMTNAPGAEIIILLKEKENGEISGSIRTTSAAVDGCSIAETFGGGGHTQAAGFRIKNKDLLRAEFEVIEAARRYQAQRLGLSDESASTEDFILQIGKKVQNTKLEDEAQKPTNTEPPIQGETLYQFED